MISAVIFWSLLSCAQTVEPLDEQKHLQPEFWRSFSNSKGCEKLSLYAWNAEGTVGLEMTALNISTFGNEEVVLDLEKKDALVLVETGSRIPENFCVQKIKQIPVAQVYEGVSGAIRLNMILGKNGKPLKVSATLENVVVVEPKTKKQITITGLNLGMLDLLERE